MAELDTKTPTATTNGGVMSPNNEAGPSTAQLPLPTSPAASARSSMDEASRIRQLEDELEMVRGEKDNLGNQYRSLLGKLTAMRKSLGDKLREDAVGSESRWSSRDSGRVLSDCV